ncbi:MAG: TfuA-like protein [Pseudomonadota bacterium]
MIAIFAGPTIAADDIRRHLAAAVVHPPARAGDLYAACRAGASAIGLIDGFFDGVPSVWHKEILWALDQGIPVYGASSMGALRAAELHVFGMTGIGAIFEGFVDGVYEDDDEVALRHGPAELGYLALSEPMVNIRATLDRAVAEGVINAPCAARLRDQAKATFFADRSWAGLLDMARDGLEPEIDRLRDWLPTGAVDQKRLDAVAMLDAMAQGMSQTPQAKFQFQHTVMWEALTRAVHTAPPAREMALILDQLRSDPATYARLRRQAADRLVHLDADDVPQRAVDQALNRFRAEHRLFTGQALERWLADQGTDLDTLRQRLTRDVQRSATLAAHRDLYFRALIDVLRAENAYAPLRAQAQQHMAQLREMGVSEPTLDDVPISPGRLFVWFFEDHLGQSVPQDLDVYLAQNDLADRGEFEQMMARAYLLWQNPARPSSDGD